MEEASIITSGREVTARVIVSAQRHTAGCSPRPDPAPAAARPADADHLN